MFDMAQRIRDMASFAGLDGCALVESETGMVWHYGGSIPGMERLGEAAIEFWRVQMRLSTELSVVGAPRFAAYSFVNRTVMLYPCSNEEDLILICVAARRGLDWAAWGLQVQNFKRDLAVFRQGGV